MSQNLNPEQLAAVEQIEGPMMVLAGPGTGKTQIIAARIAHILKTTQLGPGNILCLTFTESGTMAMRERLLQLVGTAAYYVRIHTFHSFCNEIIQENPEKFLKKRELFMLTEVERIQIMQAVLDELPGTSPLRPFAAPYLYQRACLSTIQELKREDISPQALEAQLNAIDPSALKKPEQKAWEKQKELVKAYAAYQKELEERGRYDFEDMILFVVEKFKSDPDFLATIQEQFQYILVDEYQDTNGAQNEIVGKMAEFFENPNLFVVGDDKQSIYRFQGASLENIFYFYGKYKSHVRVIALKENYRSQQTILDAAQSLIQNNERSMQTLLPEVHQDLHAASPQIPAKLQVAELESLQTENYFVATRILQHIHSGTRPSEIAVLYRDNADALDLMDFFLKLKVPFKLEAGVNVLKDADILKLIDLLEIILDPTDDTRLFQVLHFDFLGFETLQILKAAHAAGKGKTFLERLLENETFHEFAQKLLVWKKDSMNKPLVQFLDQLNKESGFLQNLMDQENSIQKLNNLNTIFDQLKSLNKAKHDLTLQEFLEHLHLLRENHLPLLAQELHTGEEAVRLMTAHRSKGLEFEHVFITQCVDKHWGNKRAQNLLKLPKNLLKNEPTPDKQSKNEEERRLFYVAMTRAKKTVTFTYSKQNGNQKPQFPSIFLQEIDPQYLENADTQAAESEALDRLQTLFLPVPPQNRSQAERAFAQSLLRNYTFNVTHLNNYLRCPRLFYYQSLLRVPSALSPSLALGNASHEALRDLTLEHKKGKLPEEAYLLRQFEKALSRQILSPKDHSRSLEKGRQTLSNYYRHYHHQWSPRSLPEYNFSSHGVHFNGIPLTGRIDRVDILDEAQKTAHVVDYKTGNPDRKTQELGPNGSYRRQILFYKLLCDLSPKFPFQMISGEINFLETSSGKDEFKRTLIVPTPQEMEEFKTTLQDVYQDIQDLKFLKTDSWTACGECDYCKLLS